MAWKNINLSEAENLFCDISKEDIHDAISELNYKLRDAGIILPNKNSYHKTHKIVRGRSISSRRAYSSKPSSKEKPARRKKIIASAIRRKREKV